MRLILLNDFDDLTGPSVCPLYDENVEDDDDENQDDDDVSSIMMMMMLKSVTEMKI